MQNKFDPKSHNLQLLEEKSNKELSILWNLSNDQIYRLRKKYNPKSIGRKFKNRNEIKIVTISINNKSEIDNDLKQIEILKQNSKPKHDWDVVELQLKHFIIECNKNNKFFTISEFCKLYNYFQTRISYAYCKLIADKYNLKLIRVPKFDHSYSKYCKLTCKCEICRLCCTLYQRYRKYKIYLSSNIVNTLANTYIEFYKEDDSQYNQIFYDKIDQIVSTDYNIDIQNLFKYRKYTR